MRPDGESGVAYAVGPAGDSGYFWFFDPDDGKPLEGLDGCGFSRRLWFSSAGPSIFQVVVTDTSTGDVRTYMNPSDPDFLSILDPNAFAGCFAVPLVITLSRYQFSPGGPDGPPIELSAGVTYRLTFHSLDVVHGMSSIPALGIAGSRVAPGADYVVTVTPTADQRGLYNFACTQVCGAEHGSMHGSIEVK